MQSSKIAVFTASGKPFSIQHTNIPSLKSGELLVRNEYVTLCRSDLNTFVGKRKEKTPTILGHEIVGRIEGFAEDHPRIDARGDELQIGDRVSWAIYASDPTDPLSTQGIPQKAADLFKYGHERISEEENLHGGLAGHTIIRSNTPLAKIDEAIPLGVASTINCAMSTVAGSLRLAGALKTKTVLISGAGMLGVVACAMCKASGAGRVVALDPNEERLQQAKSFGADITIAVQEGWEQDLADQLGESQTVHLVLEFSGVGLAMESTLKVLAIGGTAVWVGATHPHSQVHIDAEQVIRKLWTIKGLHNYNQDDFVAAVDFIEKNYDRFPFADLIHDCFSLDQVNEAFEYALAKNPFRVGLKIS
ncbi:MAG: zinc-binding dehydrogenase [Saprospiraceae bacterium]|nr:zinc-binding dehydrogenase [Saprospiraceae bacterium]